MQLKWKKIWVLSTIFVYCASFLIQSNLMLFETWAQEKNTPRVNIVAVLVDNSIYANIAWSLSWYTSEYIQKKLSDTKALIMPIDVSNLSAYDIYRMMENVYFDWLEKVNSSLIGLIMVWNIPLPVVNQDGYVFPTVYPYVDFENQKYVRDPETEYFVPNWNPEWQAEIWHWLINYWNDIEAYSKFFEKIQKYDDKPDEFIWDSLWYEDFIAAKEWFLNENFKYYRNKIMFGEDIWYQRYSPLMKDLFSDESSTSAVDIVQELWSAMKELDWNIEDVFWDVDMGEAMAALEGWWGEIPSTKMIQQEIETSLLADYNELFAKTNLSTMRENVFAWWRWTKIYEDENWQKSQIVDSDSSASMIQLKDTMYLWNQNLQWLIENLNELMEKMIDKKIEDEKYSMDIVIPLSYKKTTGKRILFKCHSLVERRDNYYFWKNARLITDPKELSMYRWTYRNLDNINWLTYDDLLTWDNAIKSTLEKTDMKLKSIWASYDIFSSQAEWNRWFLMTAVDQDLETYDMNRTDENWKITFKELLNFSAVKRRVYPQKCKEKRCEQIHPFAQRWWWWASAINLITESLENGKWRYVIDWLTTNSSWRWVYDMWWFQSLLQWEDEWMTWTWWIDGSGKWPQTAATSFKSYIKYSSPTQREWWEKKWWWIEIYETNKSDVHTGFQYLNYWNLKNTYEWRMAFTLWTTKSWANNTLNIDYVPQQKTLQCSSSRNYTYKILSSVIKHDSTTEDEINGILYDKYWDSWTLWSYYSDMMQAYAAIESDMKEILDTFPGLISTINASNDYIESKRRALNAQWDDLKSTQDSRHTKEWQRSSAESQLSSAQTSLSSAKTERDSLESQLDALYAELGALWEEDDTSSIDAEIADVESDLSNVESEISSLNSKISSLQSTISSLTTSINNDMNHEHNDEIAIAGLLNEVSKKVAVENEDITKIYKLVEWLFPENIVSVLEYIISAEWWNPSDYFDESVNDSELIKVWFLASWISSIKESHSGLITNSEKIKENYAEMHKLITRQQTERSQLASKLKWISKENISKIDSVSAEVSAVLTVVDNTKDEDWSASLNDPENTWGENVWESKPVTLTWWSANNAMNNFVYWLNEAQSLFWKVIVPDLTWAEIAMHARIDSGFNAWLTKKWIDKSTFEDKDWITQFALWAYWDWQDSEWVKDVNNQEKIQWVVIHMSWLNIITPSRPIDSPRYVSMQSIAWNEIKLIYPDLFKVEVFVLTGQNKSWYDIHELLTWWQIKEKLIEYLSWKVDEYNKILENEYNHAAQSNDYYNRLATNGYPLATPTKVKSLRPYNPFTLDEFIDALGWTWMIEVISDILYYQSLTNKKKLSTWDVSEDLSLIKKSFNINDKREQTLEDYLVEWNELIKNPLFVIPTYELSWYEVAFVNSNWKDYIIPTEEAEEIKGKTRQTGVNVNINKQPAKEEEQLDNECKIPDSWVLPLFKVENLQFTSPWWDWVKCWWEYVKKHPGKVEIRFNHSLWEINVSSGLLEFVKSTDLWESLTAWWDAMTKYADEWESIVTKWTGYDSDMRITNLMVEAENHNKWAEWGDSWASNALARFSRYIKFSNSNSRLSDNNLSSELKISSIYDIWNITINFTSTWDSCLELDWHNLCGGYSKTFNPKTQPFTWKISSADHIAWSAALDMKISLWWDYIEKIIKYKVSPSLLARAEIKLKDKRTVAWMISPVEVKWYDKYDNEVSWWLEKYKFTVTQWQFLKDWSYQPSFTTNDFRDLNFYYQAPLDAVDWSVAIIQISKASDLSVVDTQDYLWTYQQPIAQGKPEVLLNNVTILKGDQLETNQAYQLKSNEDVYVWWRLNVWKLQRLDVYMKDAKWNPIDIDSQIVVTSQNWLVVIWQVQDNGSWDLRLMETSRNYMSWWHAVIYYYPTTVAWQDFINIDIPWLDTRIINLSILPWTLANVQIVPEKEVLELQETMWLDLYLSDVWWNLVNAPYLITLFFDEEKLQFIEYPNAEDSIDVEVDGWHRTLHVLWTWAWLTYIIEWNSYAQITVDKHIFPNSGLNILYLNYFWDDWWNQRWYFSDNEKYVESVMAKSNKIIATTTQLVSEDKIKKMTWKIQPWFKVWNPDNLDVVMTLNNSHVNMIIGPITDMSASIPSFSPIQATEDVVENTLSNKDNASKNVVFFMPSEPRYSLKWWILYDSWDAAADILAWEVTLKLTKRTLSNWDNIWDVSNKWVNYWSIVMHYPNFVPRVENFSLPGSRYVVDKTFTHWTTDQLTTVWIFDLQSNFELNSTYKSIQDSDDIDERIWFLGDFKNITLFAQWEIVWEATKKFWSEFVINLWDPVLSRKSENEKVYGTEYEWWIWNEIFVDTEKDIFWTYQIDFNRDGLKDLLVVYLDWTLKLAKNYGWDPDLRNMQELMRIAVPIKEVYVWDTNGDKYEDVIILTTNNQIRAYLNRWGKFDVDGNVACLNINVRGWEISTTPSDISDIHQLFVEDMDVDGNTDIVVYDNKWFIKIFYWWSTNWGPNYLSTWVYACDTWRYLRSRWNTQTLTAFGLKVTSDPVFDNSMLHRVWMAKEEIEITEDELPDYGITISTNEDFLKSLIKPRKKKEKWSSEAVIHEIMDKFDTSKAVEKFQDESIKFQDVTLYENTLVDGGSSKNYIFAPISYLDPNCGEDIGSAWKNYRLKSWSAILQEWDIVTVRVTVKASSQSAFRWAFGDVIQWPWKLHYDENYILKWIRFIQNQNGAEVKKRDWNFAYIIDNISLWAGQSLVYEYDLEYTSIPLKDISISYETSWSPDDLPDIKVQCTDWCNKNFNAFVNGWWRSFGYELIPLQDMIDQTYQKDEDKTEDYGKTVIETEWNANDLPGIVWDSIKRISLINSMDDVSELTISDDEKWKKELKNAIMKKIEEWWLEALNVNLPIDLSLIEEQTDKIESVIDDVTKWMCNGFQFGWSHNCKWLPVPFNQAFLAPWKYHLFWCWELPLKPLEWWLPVFFFPGTLPGYEIPIPWWQKAGAEWDDFLWVDWWIYPSLIRIYAAPTLTAQLWLAICVGPYATSHLFPSPLGDVAGNCIVFAIKPQCVNSLETENPNESYEEFTEDVMVSWTCTQTQKWPTVTKNGQRDSAYDLYWYSSTFRDIKLTDADIENLLMDLERKFPTTSWRLTAEEKIKYKNISTKVWGKDRNWVDKEHLNYGCVWEKIWYEYLDEPVKMSSDMMALWMSVVTLWLFRHVLGTEYVDSLYGDINKLYNKYFWTAKLTPATDLWYGYTEYSSSLMWVINLETQAYIWTDEMDDNTKNSIMIWDVDILWWDYDVNRIRWWLQQWLKEMLVDKWLDPQIRYILNQLTKMHIVIKLPQMSNLVVNELYTINNITQWFWDIMDEASNIDFNVIKNDTIVSPKWWGRTDGWNNQSSWERFSRESLLDLSESMANPFESLASLVNQSNIMNISTRKLTVKVPFIYTEDVSSYSIYLQEWMDVNYGIFEDWKDSIKSLNASCAKKQWKEREECYAKAWEYLDALDDFEKNEWQKMLDQIYTNILILQEYRDFPFEIYEWIHAIDKYMSEITALVNNTIWYLSYWLDTNANRFVWYVDAIVLAWNIIKTYQLIIDFSVNWSKNCGNCANDTYDQYSCKLSILCKAIKLPILQIPNFKLPNITMDLTNIDLWLNIVLPEFNFQPISVELPDLPNLPEPPILWANIKLIDLPDIPQLPEPPALPELPSFIPEVDIELPILPPAPEMPKLPNKIETIINFANIVGKIYCIVKWSFGFVWEKSVKAKIEQITQRTYKVNWIDNIMDFTNRSAAPIKNYWVDYEITSYVDLQFNLSDFYNYMDVLTTSINNLSTSVTHWAQNIIDKADIATDWVDWLSDSLDSRRINVNGTLLDLDKNNWQQWLINPLWYNTELGDYTDVEFNGLLSDEIEYVDYDSAKSRLHEVLAYFRTAANETSFKDNFNSSITKIENWIDTPSSIIPNDEWVEEIRTEALDYIWMYQSWYRELAYLINNDYDKFLAMIGSEYNEDTKSWTDGDKLLTFNVNLFNLDSATKESIINVNKQNPYEMLLDNKQTIVDWYWNAINSNTADSLWLTQSQYLVLRNNIADMKQQVATLYSIVRPASTTNLIAKDSSSSVNKTLVAGLRMWSNMETSVAVDPSAFSQWIYEKMTTWDEVWRLAKVVYSDLFTSNIRDRYFHTTHKVGHDIILWTEDAIYKKCNGWSCVQWGWEYRWKTYVCSTVSSIPYKETWIQCGDSKLKIADWDEEVKNWKVKWQSFDILTFSWDIKDVDGYLIKLVDRIDYSYEKVDYTSELWSMRYVLVLPEGTDLSKLYEDKTKLELLKKTALIKDLLSKDLAEIVYYDVNKPTAKITISNIDRKWYYGRIATLDLVWDTYNINSPRSNQIVAGKQAVWDDQPPLSKQYLNRPSIPELTSEWDDLEWYVWTKYRLDVEWTDNVALSYISISQNWKLLDEKYTSLSWDTVSVEIDMHFKAEQETYDLLWIDQFGNKTEKTITVTYSIPTIEITDVIDNWNDTVAIVAELSQDVDQWNVSFQRRRWEVWKTMKKKDVECADLPIWPTMKTVIWSPYSKWTDIAMYDKGWEVMALMNPNNAEIKILSWYDKIYDVKVFVQNSAVLQVYNTWTNESTFSISIPTKKCTKIDAKNYTVVDLPENGNMWMFNWWMAVYKDGTIILLISPTWHLYSEYWLEGKYDYDRELDDVVLTLYQLSDLWKNNEIKVWLEVQPFLES